MIEIGDLDQFGFRIGPTTDEVLIRDVAIFVAGRELTEQDRTVYLPSYVSAMAREATALKAWIDYLRFERQFRGRNVSEIHNLLLHGEVDQPEEEQWRMYWFHKFMDWGEPTDAFAAFLVPYLDSLYLTYQLRKLSSPNFDRQEVVDGVAVTPYYLIETIEAALEQIALRFESPGW